MHNFELEHPGQDTVTLVEVPEGIDVVPLLGAHYHCNFLIPPYNASNAVSYIYEYNYLKKGPPERQSKSNSSPRRVIWFFIIDLCYYTGCWKFAVPSYQSLGSDFAVKFPYPIPSPAPNPPDSLGNLAQPLPPQLLRRPGDPPPVFPHLFRDAPAVDVPDPNASSSHLSKSIPFPEYVNNFETQKSVSICFDFKVSSFTNQPLPIFSCIYLRPNYTITHKR